MQLVELKAKPDADHANAYPMQDWSCQICNQHCATFPARGSGFKSTPPGQIARDRASSVGSVFAATCMMVDQDS